MNHDNCTCQCCNMERSKQRDEELELKESLKNYRYPPEPLMIIRRRTLFDIFKRIQSIEEKLGKLYSE
jgi:hypothetical protein